MMRTRSIFSALLLCAALLSAAQSASADVRVELGAERTHLIESVVAQLYPGSQLEWSPTLTLIQGSVRKPMRIGDIDLRSDAGGGYTGVVALEFTGDRLAINTALDVFEAAPSRSPSDIIAFKATAQFDVTTLRHGSLNDPASAIEQVEDVELSSLTYDNVWPDVYVTYTALYGTTETHGQIQWEEKLTTDPAVTASGRVPNNLSRTDKKSEVERTDQVKVDVVDNDTVSFASAASGHVVSNCADPCLPDGRVLLALWWTTATTTP